MKRAYSLLTIKSVDEDKRIITGIATTPEPDLMDDVVEPKGAEFKLPIPFLWQHDASQPIGYVTKAKVTKDGIEVEVHLVKTSEPGTLKDRLDEAWQSIRLGLVRGLSIGFRELEGEPIKGSFGVRFVRWIWLELSAVTVAANQAASITSIKAADLAASGTEVTPAVQRSTPPGASGTKPVSIIQPKPRDKTMTITEQIKQFEATRQAKAARMEELMKVSGEKGETLDASQEEEYDGLRSDVVSVDKHLVRLHEQEALMIARAVPVNGNGTKEAAESRAPTLVVKAPEKLDKGIEAARFVMCVAAAAMTGGGTREALSLMELHYPQQVRGINVLKAASRSGMSLSRFLDHAITTKANVVAGTTTDATWALPLVEYNQFSGDFLEYLRPMTIIGQFGQNDIPDLRRVPFNVHIRGQTSGGSGYWVGEGKPKPVTKFDFNDTYHGFYKVAAISVLTEELIRFSDPSAEALVRDALAGALIQRIDTTFIDYTIAAVSGVSPAAITNGITPILSTGDTEAAVRTDIGNLWEAGIAANLPLTSAVYITTPSIALALSLMVNSLGQPAFPNLTMRGGSLLGVPVIVSNNVPAGQLALVFASEIWLSDDGAVTVDASREATIQMLDNPTNDSVTPTATTGVSMFQTNSVALRAERFINWSKRRSTAVALLRNVSWGGAAES